MEGCSGLPGEVVLMKGKSERDERRTLEGVLGQTAFTSFLLGRCPRERVIFAGAPARVGDVARCALSLPPLPLTTPLVALPLTPLGASEAMFLNFCEKLSMVSSEATGGVGGK